MKNGAFLKLFKTFFCIEVIESGFIIQRLKQQLMKIEKDTAAIGTPPHRVAEGLKVHLGGKVLM